MKKIVWGLLLIVLVIHQLNAQSDMPQAEIEYSYDSEHLELLSDVDLSLHFHHARRTARTGGIMLGSGVLVGGFSLLMAAATWNEAWAIPFLAGVGVSVVGIPVTVAGASRKQKVSRVMETRSNGITFLVSPALISTPVSNQRVAGMSLAFSF